MRQLDRLMKLAAAALMSLAMLFALPVAATAQDFEVDEDYEYEPGEGLHEEEWYDPSDWFDYEAGVDRELDDVYDYYEGDYQEEYSEEDYEDGFGWDYSYYSDEWYDDDNDFYDWWD